MHLILDKHKINQHWVDDRMMSVSDEIKRNWMTEYAEMYNLNHLLHVNKKEIKRVYSELDPFGEENWEE